MKNVLVTGSKGFLGKNLIQALKLLNHVNVLEFHKGSAATELSDLLNRADFIFHLAGVNRPVKPEDFNFGNFVFTNEMVGILKSKKKKTGLIFSSSIQAANESLYGKSKNNAENALMSLSEQMGIFIYRLPNVFGEGCRPNYNSAVATFCYNLNQNLPIIINDENAKVSLVYVKDVVDDFIKLMTEFFSGTSLKSGFKEISPIQETFIIEVAEILARFKTGDSKFTHATIRNQAFESKLAMTFNSYKNANNS